MSIVRQPSEQSMELELVLAEKIRKAGWRLRRSPLSDNAETSLVVEAGDQRWVVALTVSSEGRRDRVIPLLSLAILQARTAARGSLSPVQPMAIVATTRVSAALLNQIKTFARQHAPDVAIGVVEPAGLRLFNGPSLGVSEPLPALRARRRSVSPRRLPNLFSDLNQWMLKILLGQDLSESVLSIPRGGFQNASRLAEAAGVSVMSASRLTARLRREGFLDEDAVPLQVVRVTDLLNRWVAANRSVAEDIPVSWIIKRDREFLHDALMRYVSNRTETTRSASPKRSIGLAADRPRCCLGLFAAADALGLGIVRGVPPHVYLERVDQNALKELGLRPASPGERPDAIVKIPPYPEAVFRASVRPGGLPVTDALQVWLDVSTHPSRGREQAAEVKRRALGPLLGDG